MDQLTHFVEEIEHAGFALDARKITAFGLYMNELRRVNYTLRLMSLNDTARIPTRHFLDSLTPALKRILSNVGTVVDVGSGGGLPGIPLAIFLPCTEFILVESSRRKSTFLNHVRRLLELRNVTVRCTRVEKMMELLPGQKYDRAVARAVGSVEQLAGLCGSMLKPEGKLICYKGPDPREEIESARPVMEKHGLVLENIYPYELKADVSPTLVVLRKE